MYTVEQDTKYVLMAMEKKPFKTWKKDRLLKMKEQEEAKKEDKATGLFSAHVMQAAEDVAEETNLKPRTFSLQGGEDDVIPRNINTEVIDVAPKFSVVQKYATYTPDYVRPSYKHACRYAYV